MVEHGFDYGEGERLSTAVSWADVFTAFITTGIPNIEVYTEADTLVRSLYQFTSAFAWFYKTPPWQFFLKLSTQLLPDTPSPAQNSIGRIIVAEAVDKSGHTFSCRMNAPDGYNFTAISVVAIIERILRGEFRAGFQTPAAVYGPDLVLEIDGVTREDIANTGHAGESYATS
jgi:short subunit dehydrogenase-like uncharacterized protein